MELLEVDGVDQPSWQHASEAASVEIPRNAVLPRLLDVALQRADKADALLNFGYDWLPLWITPHIQQPLFHLISMGAVTTVMGEAIEALGRWDQGVWPFTPRVRRLISRFQIPRVVGNGFDLQAYRFQPAETAPWDGRAASHRKGLEDAAAAAALGDRLLVWGLREDEVMRPPSNQLFHREPLNGGGFCRRRICSGTWRRGALINTPKWNEAYGNVVVEAMACGVPVIAYDRGGPGELIVPGENGFLVPPDDVSALADAIRRCGEIDRSDCRHWAERHASRDVFSGRVEAWIRAGLAADGNITAMQ